MDLAIPIPLSECLFNSPDRSQEDTAPLLLQIEGTTLSAIGPLYTPLTSTLNVYDGQASTWTGATVQFTTGYQNGQDVLSFTNTSKITGTWNAATGTLTLSGTDSLSDYRVALRSITYHNTNVTPNTSVTRTVVQVNDSTQLTYKVNTSSIAIMTMALVTDADASNLSSLTIQISSGYQSGHDVFGYGNVTGITVSFTASTGTLTLSGVSSVSNYRTALREVTFHTVGTGVSTATRVFKVIATDTLNESSVPVTRSMTVTA